MKTIKELEADLKVAIAINNVEWTIQLEAKLQHTKDVLRVIDETTAKLIYKKGRSERECRCFEELEDELKKRITGT